MVQKGTKNGTKNGTLSLRLSGVRELRFCELNESGEIAIATGIIFAKRKGGIERGRNDEESKVGGDLWRRTQRSGGKEEEGNDDLLIGPVLVLLGIHDLAVDDRGVAA